MIATKKWEYSLAILFAIGSLLILILIAWTLNFGKDYRSQLLQELQNVKSAGFTMEQIPNYQFNKQQLIDYADIVERPLFFKGRRPIVINDEDTSSIEEIKVVDKIDYIFMGVTDTPRGLFAFFKNPKAGPDNEKFLRFEQGALMQGWVLKTINHNLVVIENEGKNETIKLRKPLKASSVPINRLKQPKNKKQKKNQNNTQKMQQKKPANPFLTTNPFKRNTQ